MTTTLARALDFPWIQAVAIGVYFAIPLFALSYIYWRWRKEELGEKSSPKNHSDNTVKFYQDRTELGHLSELIRGAGDVWGSWSEGGYIAHQGIFGHGNVKRAILLDPEGDHINYVSKEISRTVEDIRQSILFAANRGKENRVDVRFYDGPITSTIIAKQDGWIRIDTSFSFLPGSKRPSYMLDRNTHPKAFDEITESYQRLWDNSRQPEDRASQTLASRLKDATAKNNDLLKTVEIDKDQIKSLSTQLETSQAKLNIVIRESEKQKKLHDEEHKQFKDFQRQHGLWRIACCGQDNSSLDLEITIQFVDHNDADLAKRISSFFGISDLGTPWKVHEIENVRWKQNPAGVRIVVFSDNQRAAGVVAAFRDCNLIEESMQKYPAHMYPWGGREGMKDIAIVIFDKVQEVD